MEAKIREECKGRCFIQRGDGSFYGNCGKYQLVYCYICERRAPQWMLDCNENRCFDCAFKGITPERLNAREIELERRSKGENLNVFIVVKN